MKLKNRMMWMTVSVFLALTVSVLRVVPAYADGPAPTDEQPVEVGTPPEGELEQVPEGTEVVVVDENSEVLPLATQAAAEAIVEKDPIWCPAGVAPKPNMGGCSPSYGSLSALVAGGSPGGNGTIWIEAGNDGGAEVEINGAGNWATATNYSLTLQGGWIGGLAGSKAIIGVSTFDTGISIVNWNGNVIVKDIAMVNATNTLHSNTGALYVETSKNITLANVTASGTTGGTSDGAYLDNTSSTTQASVIVKNSSFNDNQQRGLSVYSDGVITITNISANSNNGSSGAYLANTADLVASPIVVSGSNFLSNWLYGLYIYSNGAVKLTNITASMNVGDGVYINNTPASIAAPVTVSGFYYSEMNGGNGITVRSDGSVTLANVSALYNSDKGIDIDNSTAASPLGVTLIGSSQILNNGLDGLYIITRGAVNANNITANENGFASDNNGVYISNNLDATKPQNVTFTGVNSFLGNARSGMMIATYGAVTLVSVSANGNGHNVNDNSDNGVSIISTGFVYPKAVVLKGTNVFNDNDGKGLYVVTYGSIAVSNITANGNDGAGAFLINSLGVQSPVILTGYATFKSNGEQGLYISSNGSVSTTNLTASYNSASDGVYINTTGITAPQSVSIKGNNVFTANGNAGSESGLRVYADGNITVANLIASLNYYSGAFLDNKTNWLSGTFATFGSISMTGGNSFYANQFGAGVNLITHGKVTMSNVHASFNTANTGVSITSDGNVTLSCVFANNNAWGIWMYSQVNLLTIKGLYAVDNTTLNEHLDAITINRSGCP